MERWYGSNLIEGSNPSPSANENQYAFWYTVFSFVNKHDIKKAVAQGFLLGLLLLVIILVPLTLLIASSGKAGDIPAVPVETQELKADNPKIIFTGDLMLDRGVAIRAKNYGDASLAMGLSDIFRGSDAVVGNLEGTITNEKSVAIPDNSIFNFTFDPHYAEWLKSVGFTALSSANNHSLDFGNSGYLKTVNYLRKAGIVSFGSTLNNVNISGELKIKNQNICLVGYHSLYDPNTASVIKEIERIKPQCSYLILVAHWGVEYELQPSLEQQALAHILIDAGVDAIFGAHPHVVEPLEIYKGKVIFYSLGNFIFDQNFSVKTTRGLAVRVEIGQDKVSFSLLPLSINHSEVSLASEDVAEKVIEDLISGALPSEISSAIVSGKSFDLVR